MNKENLKNLLNSNRKALQFLHGFKRMDFEQPFEIFSEEEKFTAKSLQKNIGITDYENYQFALFIVYKFTNKNESYFVDIDVTADGNFVFNIEYGNLKYGIRRFKSKAKFERARIYKSKEYSKRWFLIVQKKEYAVPLSVNKKIDFTERFTDTEQEKYPTLKFDKSGYLLNNSSIRYSAKAEQFRAVKEKKKADDYNGLPVAYETKAKIENLFPLISDVFNKKEFSKLTDIFDRHNGFSATYNQINNHIQKLESKTFTSVKEIENSIKAIQKNYELILSIIEKNNLAEQGKGF